MYAANSRADPLQTGTGQKKTEKFFQKAAERRRKRIASIRPARMYKKIIMQKNMQKINLCRPGIQLSVDMLYKALKRSIMAFYIAPISEYPQRANTP